MIKIVLPVLLASVVMIAGIFAFMPIDKASTVHTTIQTTIQNTQLNNIASGFQTDMANNATATCGSGSAFLVYFTFSNNTVLGKATALTVLGISDAVLDQTADTTLTLSLGNQTSVSGVIGGSAGETITFYGNGTGASSGLATNEDVGDLSLAVVCRTTDSASTTPSS